MLVTPSGENIPPARGVTRAMQEINFPQNTFSATKLFPDLSDYQGLPLEFGRMEVTASDPEVDSQYGMIVGDESNHQLNALATLNIRGERSVTCKGDFDLHPSLGPLPPGAPPVCELFRQFPDALEQAEILDKTYGSNPPLEELPRYGVVFSWL